MRYHNITKDDMNNGDGLRVVLWVAGCNHHCPDCQNPVTWDEKGGLEFDDSAKKEIFDCLKEDYISGITLSGGDPLYPSNREEIKNLIKEIKNKFKEKTVWLYTGYTYEEISSLPFIEGIDIVVDGKFEKEKKNISLKWRGSSNQRVIDVKKTINNNNKVVLYCD